MANVMNTGNEGVATDETGSLIAARGANCLIGKHREVGDTLRLGLRTGRKLVVNA